METKSDKHNLDDLDLETMDSEHFKTYAVEPPSDDPKTNRQHAIERAARMLALRPYSRQGLYRKLIQRGFPAQAAQAAIDRMEEIGVLDDEEYGRNLIERLVKKGYGPLRIEMELYKAGVERDLRDALLQELSPERELAMRFLQKTCDPDDLLDGTYRSKLANAMKRKGYGWSAISESMREYEDIAEDKRAEWERTQTQTGQVEKQWGRSEEE